MAYDDENRRRLDYNRDVIDECKRIIDRHLDKRRDVLLQRYGPSINCYFTSLDLTIQSLADGWLNTRLQALEVLKDYWGIEGIRQVSEEILRRLATGANTSEERRLAIYLLRTLYSGTGEPEIMRFFARIVLDERIDNTVRSVAYEGLLEVSGTPVHDWPSMQSDDWSFPDLVDWDSVRHHIF